ncbi:MAG: DUF2237 domain-containing protein [Microcoleus sp. PH2017_17_BER_D_A]|nr:DUF2237 domain-containing protein [Microcoleus sp. PH2017_17_BER_D_A]
MVTEATNVLGTKLETCCTSPMTGYYRDGKCNTGGGDLGAHTVCAKVTEEFLKYTKRMGNDLSTPVPDFKFPGLKPGDCWCLCASAPLVVLSATHVLTLEYVSLNELKEHAADL